MTTALYRRYRPETFAEVIGQEQVTGPLSVALTKNRVNHAYLFSGPRGCGKTTSARILARCLNCEQGPTPTPCGTCPSCVDLARGGPGSLDVVEIDAASHGGVDDARDLRERAAFAPVRDRYKVFIIDEAHMVSPQGFNALLKIVEEPPEHIRFIFATTEPEKVIGTIRSRTHHYPFRLVPPERLTQYLAELCEREAVPVGKGVLPLVVRAGGGSVRDTLSVLDQLIGGAGEEGLSYATAIGLLGYTDSALLDDVADALAAGDGATVFRVIDRVIESGHDPRRFVEDLLERLRDLLVVAAVRDGGHAVFRGMPDDQLERMRNQASRFGSAELSRAADVTNAALTEMTGATSPRLQLELLCARLLLPAADDEQRGLGARLDRLEKRIGSGSAAVPAVAPVTSPVAAGGPAPASPAVEPVAPQTMASGLAAVRAAMGSTSRSAAGDTADAPTPNGPAHPQDAPGQPSQEPSRPAPAVSTASGAGEAGEPAPSGAGQPAAAVRRPEPNQSNQPNQPNPREEPVPAAAAQTSAGGDLEAVRRNWNEVLGAVASIKRTTWSLVSQYAQVLDHDGRRLLLGFDSVGRAQSFGRGPHPNFMRQALIEVLGVDCVVEATVTSQFRAGTSGGGAGPAAPTGAAPTGPAGRGPAPSSRPPVSAPDPSGQPGPQHPGQQQPARQQPAQQRSGPVNGWAERPAAPVPPDARAAAGSSAWTEVARPGPSAPQGAVPAATPAHLGGQTVAAETAAGGVGVIPRAEGAPPAGGPARSIGAAAARAAAAAAVAAARQHNGPDRSREHARARFTDPAQEPDMPTPQSSPYDDIPPDLDEPVREDEVPPDSDWATPAPRSSRPEPAHAGPQPGGPAASAVDLAARTGRASEADASALVGVQAVEQLLGGRVIEERDL